MNQKSCEPESLRRMVLCKRCVDALGRGRYLVRRADAGRPTIVRSCELCHFRTSCGDYDVSTKKHELVQRVNWRTRMKQSASAPTAVIDGIQKEQGVSD